FSFEHLVRRLEGFFIDAELALGEIADVTDGCFDDVIAADEFVDRLRFRGRLDDDEVFGHCGTPQTSAPTPEFLAGASCARVREASKQSEARTIAPEGGKAKKGYGTWSLSRSVVRLRRRGTSWNVECEMLN